MNNFRLAHHLMSSIAEIERDSVMRIHHDTGRRQSERYFLAERHAIPVNLNFYFRNSGLCAGKARSNVDGAGLLPDRGWKISRDSKQSNDQKASRDPHKI